MVCSAGSFYVALLCLVLLIVLNTVEIVSRYFFHYSFTWIQEVSLLLVSWMIFLGFARVVVEKQDIAITFFVDKLPQKYVKPVQLLNHVLMFGVSLYLCIRTISLISIQLDKTTEIAGLPYALYLLPLAAAMLMVVLQSIVEAIEIMQQWNAREGQRSG